MYPIYLVLSETEAEAVGSALNRARIAEIALLRRQGRGDCLAERTIQAIDRVRAQMETATPPPPTRAADFARAFYLSYVNEYLTASRIAEAHGIPESLALALIESGRL